MGIRSQNNPITAYLDVFSNTGTDAAGAAAPSGPSQTPAGITATGGIISDFTDPVDGFNYRAHIFRSLDSFAVTGVTGPGLVDFLVVGGGGSGGGGESGAGGGGGSGGYRTSMPEGPGGPSPSAESQVTVSTGTYVVTIGAGGGAGGRNTLAGASGTNSNIAFPSAITSIGGGAGGYYPPAGATSGGSGGGGQGNNGGSGAAGSAGQGYNGGNGGPYTNYIYIAGGGGGAGSLGAAGSFPGSPHPANAQAGAGGAGKLSTITGSAPITAIGFPGPGPVNAGWIAGGGGGGSGNEPPAPSDAGKGGGGGGGTHASPYAGAGEGTQYAFDDPIPGRANPGTPYTKTAKANSGSGGGGGGFSRAQYDPGNIRHQGGSGGSGIVVVRYLQDQLTAKATGGAITAFNSKTVHIFQNSGTFTSTGGNITNCEIVCVAGGGGGGGRGGAGGGAGGYRHRTSVTIPSVAHTIVVGGGGYGDIGKDFPAGGGGHSSIRDSGNSNPYISFATGGGGAGSYNNSGNPGGSGGGVGWPSGTYNEGNTVASPDGHSPTVQGYRGGNTTGPGGSGAANPHSSTGGGGGSAVGGDGKSPQPYTGVAGGNGGAGQQLPATFHIPSIEPGAYTGSTRGPSPAYGDSTFYANYGPGDLRSGLGAPGPATHPSPGSVNTNGKYWVCGGGGGGTFRNHGTGGRGGFPGSTASSDIPYAGGGHSFGETAPTAGQPGQHGFVGTGGGGGGSFYGAGDPSTDSENLGGHGGSGIVLIAYPS